ncbi:hypothetical protein F5148DRAFT_1186770 [Russula earlei]|uniref:Uncharacterized protein n=1 Tax=Russula earlei TaxID=71964 RepID=A0ACC0UE06_9AGAM|nr:hypothetical protein F5148DRAFT_1186770 [Russula earlei]
MLKFRKYEEERDRELILYLKSVSQGATLASWVFEANAHRKIIAGVNGQPMREMKFHSDPHKFVSQSAGSSQSSSPTPWLVVKLKGPSAPNFPLIDVFIVTHDDNPNTMHLWVLQMTISKTHRGSRKGYAKIGKIIDTLCLRSMRPMRTVKRHCVSQTSQVLAHQARHRNGRSKKRTWLGRR